METEEDEEEYEEIIDDEACESEVDKATDAKAKVNENACFGLGSLERPFVKFYFTSPCPELGLEKVRSPSFCHIKSLLR